MKNKKTRNLNLGTFKLTQDVMRVSDPGYAKDVWCSATIKDCLPGPWQAHAVIKDEGDWGDRISKLMVLHDSSPEVLDLLQQVSVSGDGRTMTAPTCLEYARDLTIGVDSGQAGFFDEVNFSVDSSVPDFEEEADFGSKWYSYCCHLTLCEDQAGVLPYGAVSSSGLGDGSYDLFIHRNNKEQVDGMCLLFL